MISSQKVARERYSLFVLAIVLLLLGGLGIYLGSHNFTIRVLGVTAVIASTYLVRISTVRSQSELPEAGGAGTALKRAQGPGRLAWGAALVLVFLLGASLFLLHQDAINGSHARWPADLFFGVGIAFAL